MRNVSLRIAKYAFRFRRLASSTAERKRANRLTAGRASGFEREDLTLRSDAHHRLPKGGPGSEQPFFGAGAPQNEVFEMGNDGAEKVAQKRSQAPEIVRSRKLAGAYPEARARRSADSQSETDPRR
jgi:hypothetical protein